MHLARCHSVAADARLSPVGRGSMATRPCSGAALEAVIMSGQIGKPDNPDHLAERLLSGLWRLAGAPPEITSAPSKKAQEPGRLASAAIPAGIRHSQDPTELSSGARERAIWCVQVIDLLTGHGAGRTAWTGTANHRPVHSRHYGSRAGFDQLISYQSRVGQLGCICPPLEIRVSGMPRLPPPVSWTSASKTRI